MRTIAGPGSGSGTFTDYDPQTNPDGTVITADWANDVQDELIGIQNDQGISEGPGSNYLVLEAIGKKILKESLGMLYKSDREQPVLEKTGSFSLQSTQDFWARTDSGVVYVSAGTSVDVSGVSSTAGTDYTYWVDANSNIIVSDSFSTPPVTGAVLVGGFHYAPGGNAVLDANGNWANHTGGNTTVQINPYSIWDLKWRPAVDDPRGLALVPGLDEWWGIYPISNGNEGGPLHMYGVDPCRDTNAPYKMWADTPTRYNGATPMNIFELLAYYGFRPPQPWNFQFAALGTTEETSAGGSGPGLTGDMSDSRNKEQFTSAWGLFDITGVIRAWSSDSWLDTSDTLGVTQGRSDEIFRIQRFAYLGGYWGDGTRSGSRYVNTNTSSTSGTSIGGRGVCDHVVLV